MLVQLDLKSFSMYHDNRSYRVLHNYWKFLQIMFGFEMLVLLRQLRFVLIFDRYALVIEDSVIKSVNTEPDHTGLACLLCIRNFRSAQSAGATWSVLGGAEWFWCKCGRLKEVCDCMVLKRILILGKALYNLVEFTQPTPVTFCWFYLYCCILFLQVQVSM